MSLALTVFRQLVGEVPREKKIELALEVNKELANTKGIREFVISRYPPVCDPLSELAREILEKLIPEAFDYHHICRGYASLFRLHPIVLAVIRKLGPYAAPPGGSIWIVQFEAGITQRVKIKNMIDDENYCIESLEIDGEFSISEVLKIEELMKTEIPEEKIDQIIAEVADRREVSLDPEKIAEWNRK